MWKVFRLQLGANPVHQVYGVKKWALKKSRGVNIAVLAAIAQLWAHLQLLHV